MIVGSYLALSKGDRNGKVTVKFHILHWEAMPSSCLLGARRFIFVFTDVTNSAICFFMPNTVEVIFYTPDCGAHTIVGDLW